MKPQTIITNSVKAKTGYNCVVTQDHTHTPGPSWSWSYGSWIYNCLFNSYHH